MTEPTLEEIDEMKQGNQILVARHLSWLLMMAEIEIRGRPQAEEAMERWEKFKTKIANSRWVINGLGI